MRSCPSCSYPTDSVILAVVCVFLSASSWALCSAPCWFSLPYFTSETSPKIPVLAVLVESSLLSPWKEPSPYPGPQFFLSKPSLGREGGPGQSVSGWSEAGLGHHCRRQGRAEWPALALSRDPDGRALCHLLALYLQRFLLCKVRNPQGC